MQAKTVSLRTDEALFAQTRALAEASGQKRSEYLRNAVREKNARVLAKHLAALSTELATDHLCFNESIEGCLAEGID
jgi:predicted transcriptional regulator